MVHRLLDSSSKIDNFTKKKKKKSDMTDSMTGYCLRCKKKQDIENPKINVTKNNRHMIKGTCPDCDTTICRFISSS
jgi:hypothetical protein